MTFQNMYTLKLQEPKLLMNVCALVQRTAGNPLSILNLSMVHFFWCVGWGGGGEYFRRCYTCMKF